MHLILTVRICCHNMYLRNMENKRPELNKIYFSSRTFIFLVLMYEKNNATLSVLFFRSKIKKIM